MTGLAVAGPTICCAFWECQARPIIVATVLSGDADYMHESDNGLCGEHHLMVLSRWLSELVAGGPVRRITILRTIAP